MLHFEHLSYNIFLYVRRYDCTMYVITRKWNRGQTSPISDLIKRFSFYCTAFKDAWFITVHFKGIKKNYQRSNYNKMLWLQYTVYLYMPNLKETCI